MRWLALLCLCAPTLAHEGEGPVAEDQGHVIEVSFGNAQLFIEQPLLAEQADSGRTAVIPVSAALLMVEWLALPRLSVVTLFNMPLESDRRFVDGQLRESFAAPALATGVRWSPISVPVFRQARAELQLAALVGTTIGSQDEDFFFPLLAGRTHIRSRGGASIFLGASWAFAKETLAVIYGVGHRF